MGLFDFWRRQDQPQAVAAPDMRPRAEGAVFYSLDDPALAEFLRAGHSTHSGAVVGVSDAMRNTTVFRCVSLVSYSIGMLPLHLLRGDDFDSDKASDHPLYELLYAEPNNWQTAFDFRSHMQLNALVHGDAYARVIRSRGQVIRLVPMDPTKTEPVQNADWSVSYRYQRPDGSRIELAPGDVFHLRGLSMDGIRGLSLVKQAAEAIGLAIQTEVAAARLFKNGMLIGGSLEHPNKLSPEAYDRLKVSMEERYSGAENAHKWLILEEGMKPGKLDHSAADSQHLETRKHQIEEIGRIFGVPRPLLGVDDTSWGTGIEQLGIGFVRYALSPWFVAWEQAIRRTLLTRDEKETYKPKFNEGALLRGSMKDQADFFAKALGAGGHAPWMKVNEVRGLMNLKEDPDGDKLGQSAMAARTTEGSENDPPQAA